jgi:hypothetical protein
MRLTAACVALGLSVAATEALAVNATALGNVPITVNASGVAATQLTTDGPVDAVEWPGALHLSTAQQLRAQVILESALRQDRALADCQRAAAAALAATPPGERTRASLAILARSYAAVRAQVSREARTRIFAILTASQRARMAVFVAAAARVRLQAHVAEWRIPSR